MSTRSVKQQITRAGTSINVTEARAIVAEAKKGSVTVGEKQAVKDLFDKGKLSDAARVELGNFLGAGSTLGSLIPGDWRKALSDELATPAFAGLEKFLGEEQ